MADYLRWDEDENHPEKLLMVAKQVSPDPYLQLFTTYHSQFCEMCRPDPPSYTNNVVTRFIYASNKGTPTHMIKNGTTYRILSDLLGSPRLVVDTVTGAIVQRNGPVDTDYGVVDLDWFTDLIAFWGTNQFGVLHADATYIIGKLIWNAIRVSNDQPYAGLYEDPKGQLILSLLRYGIDSYSDLFPDSFMDINCPQMCLAK